MVGKHKSTNDWLWSVVELAVAFTVGLILYFPLKNKDLAKLIWAIGPVLTLLSLQITMAIRKELTMASNASAALDLSATCSIDKISRILNLYLQIDNPELRPVKEDYIDSCVEALRDLASGRTSPNISGTDYYRWLKSMLEGCMRKDYIYAASTMIESAWSELAPENAYMEQNIEAAKRGVLIERVFITSRDRLNDPKNLDILRKYVGSGMRAYIVFADLISQDQRMIQRVGPGFVVFGERAAMIDDSVPPDEANGRVSTDPSTLKRYKELFECLKLQGMLVTRKSIDDLSQRTNAEPHISDKD